MKSNISLDAIPALFTKILRRYHVMLFTVLILGGLVVLMYVINQTINTSTDTTQIEGQGQLEQPFDKKTIDQLQELDNNSQSSELNIPSGQRVSPFVE